MRNLLAALVLGVFAVATPALADKPPENPIAKPIELPGGEVIIIHDRVAQPAKSSRDPSLLPPYSDRAITSNEWTRAWLLLDIDATGTVRRLKFVHKPGLDLEPIAAAHAFATHFSPATDRSGNRVASRLVWGLEWPAYWWMVHHMQNVARLPGNGLPRCRGTGPLQLGSMVDSVYSDCTTPDMAHPEKWGEWIFSK
jgi:hypothetical protein